MKFLAKRRHVKNPKEDDSITEHFIFGHRVRVDCEENSLEAVYQLRDLQTIYEPFLASRSIPQEGICLDLGAGAGWFGISFAIAFRGWTVICVEPDPAQFAFLKDNVSRLGLKNVVCIHAAIHPEAQTEAIDAASILRGEVKARPAHFQRLVALPRHSTPVLSDGKKSRDTLSYPALHPSLIADLKPDFIRLDAPGCEAAIAQAIKDVPTGFIVGKVYPYLPSHLFSPSESGGAREFYLVHGEHVLRRDYEDNFAMRRPGLDVVVAMYNTYEFIQECVDSVLADGNPDIRALVVDDGSTDGCGDHVETLYRGNPRVKLLRKANGGCASARNFGRRHSDASHIAFIDADDRVDSGMFSALLEVARYTGAFVTEGEFKTFVKNPDGGEAFSASYEDEIYKLAGHHLLGQNDYDWIPGSNIISGQPTIWRRVHRRDFLDRKNVWFPEHVRAFDDQIFQVLVGQYAGSVAHVRGHKYHYRQHAGQDIKQGDERHFYSFNMFRSIFLRALDEGWDDLSYIFRSLLNTMSWSYGGLREDLKAVYEEAAVEFLAVIDKTFGHVITSHMLQGVSIPGLDYLVQRRIQEMATTSVHYSMMRLESWRWQPEFIRMMMSAQGCAGSMAYRPAKG